MPTKTSAVVLAVAISAVLAGCGNSSTVRTVTIRAAAPPPIIKWRTKTIVKHERVEAPTASQATPTTTDCNDLPPGASTNLTEIRESRCEMEKLNADSPSAANEHEIETMISDERAIEASE
jgi:hypothetical protein